MSTSFLKQVILVRLPVRPYILVLALIISSNACSLFDTREPEEPGSTTVPVFIQPDRPQDVIQNLTNAVNALNLDNYRRCFSPENFQYEPTSEAQSSNPDVWQGWGIGEEEAYFNNMRSEAEDLGGQSLSFQNVSYIQIQSGEEQFEADYELTINHNRQGLPSEARGRIRLFIHRDEGGQWAIHSWSDASAGSEFTWSDFRAAFL